MFKNPASKVAFHSLAKVVNAIQASDKSSCLGENKVRSLLHTLPLTQWFLMGGSFACLGTFTNVWRHF